MRRDMQGLTSTTGFQLKHEMCPVFGSAVCIARNEKSHLGLVESCGTVNQWDSTSREVLNGNLAPQALRLTHLAPECRGTKRNLTNLPNSQHLWGFPPISP